MLCLNVPKKVTSIVSVWVSVVLILIAAYLCFQPMFSLTVNNDVLKDMDELVEDFGEDLDFSFADIVKEDEIKIDVSVADLASATALIAQLVSSASSENAEKIDFKEMIDTPEGEKTLLMGTALALTVMNALDVKSIGDGVKDIEDTMDGAQTRVEGALEGVGSEEEAEDAINDAIADTQGQIKDQAVKLADNVFMMLLKMLVVLIALLVVLFYTIFIPIRVCFSALIAVITALVNVVKPEVAAPKVTKRLPKMLVMPITLILYSCVVPGLGIGTGALGILFVCFASVLLAVVLSRLHSYTPAQMKYANCLQAVSIVGVVGYLVYFFNLINVGAFNSFVNGKISSHVMNVMLAEAAKTEVSSAASTGYIIDVACMLLTVIFVLLSTRYLVSCLRRLSMAISVKEGKSSIKDVILPRALLLLPIYFLPKLVMDSANYFADVTASKGDASLLVLSAEQQSAFDGMFVGIIIILVAEIAMIVCKAGVCHDVSKEDKGLVLSGNACAVAAPAVEEAPAEEAPAEDVPAMAEAPVEEAPAEEAPAEEAPVEEAPVEEAPAEEAPAEEAPAEEAPTEEASSEE